MPKDSTQFGRVPYAVIDSGAVAEMPRGEAVVYLVIAGHLNGSDWTARPSLGRIMRLAGVTERTAQRSIKRLVKAGYIKVSKGGGRGHTNVYTIVAKPRQDGDGVTPQKPRQDSDPVSAETPPNRALNPAKSRPKPRHNSDGGTEGTDSETEKPSAKKRAPDAIWETVVQIWFPSGVAPSDQKRIGKIVRDLKAKGATPDEILTRLDRYRRQWPAAADTPEAVVKHWDRFAIEPTGRGGPVDPATERRRQKAAQEHPEPKLGLPRL